MQVDRCIETALGPDVLRDVRPILMLNDAESLEGIRANFRSHRSRNAGILTGLRSGVDG